VVLRDNARNMSKGMDGAGVASIGCLAHLLQLVVKVGLESQRAVEDAVSVCRKIATLFSHSTLAKERLAGIQRSIPGLEQHAIIQVHVFAGLYVLQCRQFNNKLNYRLSNVNFFNDEIT